LTRGWRGALLVSLLLLAGCARDRSAPGLYRSFCKRCHGGNGEGKPRALKLYPKSNLLLSEMVLQGDRDAVRDRIANGKGPMPGFKRRLTPAELESLVDFTIRLASEQDKKE
jgi:mono/diheme cytochrome c family protein